MTLKLPPPCLQNFPQRQGVSAPEPQNQCQSLNHFAVRVVSWADMPVKRSQHYKTGMQQRKISR